jgi:polar amino acid transport system substrate-binding protein
MFRKPNLGWAVPVLLLLAGECRAQDLAAVQQRGKLVLLCFPHLGNGFLQVDLDKGPMVKSGGPERFKGFDIELMKRFAASLGVALEVRPVGEPRYGALIPELLAGKGDLIAGGFSITEERKKEVDFTRPYFAVQPVVVALAVTDLKSVGDLAQKTGAVLAGSSNEQRLKRLGVPAERIRPVEFGEQGLDLVLEGGADYWATEIGEGDSGAAATAGNPKLKVALQLPEREGIGVAGRKHSDLLQELDRFLARLEASGELKRLKEEFLGK